MKQHIFIPLIFVFLFSNAQAGPQWWQQVYPSNANTQINLKDQNNNTVTAITNPTAANVNISSNTNTQPPTVILQATGGVLTVNPNGTTCNSSTANQAMWNGTQVVVCDGTSWKPWAPTPTGSIGTGFQASDDNLGNILSCGQPNPATGSCSCLSGWTPVITNTVHYSGGFHADYICAR